MGSVISDADPVEIGFFNDGSLYGAVSEWSAITGGYQLTLSGPAFSILSDWGYVQIADVIRTLPVPPNWIGLLIKGGTYLATFAVAGYAAWKLHHEFAQSKPSPYGWPGNDPAHAPGAEWEWLPQGTPVGGTIGNWHNPSSGESLHPDLNNDVEGPHWDYNDPQNKGWRIWPDGKMTPKKG